ncbi:Epsin-3, clathrin recruitment and traffic between the Golgi and endosome [Sporothrix curviconia]|uniref:Epsin-3, clathrin recruitment and traffic between the Golgi and endosome n=1 Tax=Sporothrix curviconia TaxID=1260050 RepID=A0ABP0CIQ8_9PEZI
MDFSNLKESVANLTLYDLKAGVRKVQNAVMNYTEMESKVREATNNEPWGASSTLMQEIANGTFNYQTLNEIMPMIYRRFTEKSAEEWRQIYKALQLLEFLIKHGSERVIDDARSHLTLLKMLRQFHFIDANGKDQGINVRNRSKELAELLGDVDRIRTERKKARANKGKYTGVGSSVGNSRFGGFGSDSGGFGSSGGGGGGSGGYGGYSGGVYGDGGGFGGQSDYNEAGGSTSLGGSRAERFEEYDEYDEGESRSSSAAAAAASRSSAGAASARAGVRRTTGGTTGKRTASSSAASAAAEPPKPKAPEVDLFSFDEPAPTTTTMATTTAPLAAAADNDDDDFDDFQSAPTPAAPAGGNALAGLAALSSPPPTTSTAAGAQFAAPQPVSAPKQVSLTDMMGISSISPPPATGGANYAAFHAPPPQQQQQQQQPQQRAAPISGYQPTQPNYYQSVQAQPLSGAGAMSSTTSVFPQSSLSSSVFGQASSATPTSTTSAGMAALRPVMSSATSTSSVAKSTTAASSGGGDAFGSLWSTASTGIKKTGGAGAGKGPSMGQLAQEKSHAAIWGAPAASSSSSGNVKPAAAPTGSSNGLDDLLG